MLLQVFFSHSANGHIFEVLDGVSRALSHCLQNFPVLIIKFNKQLLLLLERVF